jgi:hypothetical protein
MAENDHTLSQRPEHDTMKTLVLGLVSLMSACAGLEAYEAKTPSAQFTVFQLSLWNPVQLVPDDSDVRGLRLNIPYGKIQNAYGLDYGIVNIVSEDVAGIQMGIYNKASDARGIQIAAWFNITDSMSGIQFGVANTASSSSMHGLQNGGVNYAKEMYGMQNGGVNVTKKLNGIQIGVVNYDGEMNGLQIGIVNFAESVSGVQFGVANIIQSSSVPFFPFINAHF